MESRLGGSTHNTISPQKMGMSMVSLPKEIIYSKAAHQGVWTELKQKPSDLNVFEKYKTRDF
jgi:hypothetical protein